MSELITLDEAIEWGKRGELCDLMTEDDQRQVAEWLRQARGAESAARWYTAKLRDAHRTIRKLLNENAKLRELVGYFLRCERCLCDGCPLNEHGLCSILEKAEELGFEVPE